MRADAKCGRCKGFIALSHDLYHPVSGNWCWIQARPSYWRYVLTHMWRFAFIILCTGIYVYIFIYLRRHFKKLQLFETLNRPKTQHDSAKETEEMGSLSSNNQRAASGRGSRDVLILPSSSSSRDIIPRHASLPVKSAAQNGNNPDAREARIKKILLLNSYPIMYIILWIPGIVNRIVEATGRSSRVLQLLQTSTTFIGLVNAITYGLTENVLEKLKKRFRRR